jgi:hypothetical protein
MIRIVTAILTALLLGAAPQASLNVSVTAATGTLLWSIGGPSSIATEGNGSDVGIVNGSTESFAINRPSATATATEYRDMIKIAPGNNTYFVTAGTEYALRMTFGNTMTVDTGSLAQLLIWQIAPNGSGGTTSCNDEPNIAFQLRTISGVNYLALYEYCYGSGGDNSIVWKTPYSAGGSESFEFDVLMSKTSSGYTKVYENGTLIYTYNGITLGATQTLNPRIDIGAYESQWLDNPTGSNVASQNVTFDAFTVSSLP